MSEKIKIKSACRMCHGGCGVLVYLEDNRVVKIEGDPESPLNRGKICPKGAASIDHLYNEKRLKYPLKSKGPRGSGAWERISWDEALDTVVANIRTIKDRYGIEAIALAQGTGRPHFFHVPRFAHALGTPNWCEPGLAQCFIPRIFAGFMTYGGLFITDHYGDVNPQCLLVWGQNPIISGPDGEVQFRVKDCLKRGTCLIVVDPRRTEMAEKAELWLQIRPGTDAALAMSMMHIMIKESLYDHDFVERWTTGFDALAERVQSYTPEWAEKVTWVPADKIREAARLYARTKPAALHWGVGLEHTPNCLQTVRSVALLPGLTGNIDVPGGSILGMHVMPDAPILSERLSPEMADKRLGGNDYKILSGRNSLFPSAHIPTIMQAINTGKPYPVKSMLLFGNNGLIGFADTKYVHRSMMNLDFIMAMELYMTPTAELADIVLPSATWLETNELAALPFAAPHVILIQQRVTGIGECRPVEEVLVELARRMQLPCGTESVEEIYRQQLDVAGLIHPELQGITFENLKEKGFVCVPIEYKKYEKHGFMTPSGKVELASSMMQAEGYDPLPYYVEPPESPVSQPELAEKYPLILTTGGRSQYFFLSEYRQIDALRKKHPHPRVQIHPDTARRHQIEEGDWVWIESPRGRIKQVARLTDGIDPRVVNVEHGWWYPEDPKPEYGVWKSNANVLTSMDPPYDPAMGTYQLRALLCRIYPCN